ncbi:MAG: hypothetical protein AAF467_10470 [Actinomycetota bacterium]
MVTTTRDVDVSETRGNRAMRYALMALLGFQALFVGVAPLAVLVAFDSFREVSFGGDTGSEVELNTVLLAALLGFMALVCAYGVAMLYRRRVEGAILGLLVGVYLVYVGAAPELVLDRSDFVLMDVPRGLMMVALGLLVARSTRTTRRFSI